MPEFTSPVTGRFCWVELQTRDAAAAQKLYGPLFGWTFEDLPLPEGTYTVAKLGDRMAAGLVRQPDAAAQAGTPPSWGVYVAVDDVKASTEAASRLGARVLVGPTRLGPGTFSVLADPAGGAFLLWHTTQWLGTTVYGEINSLSWNELLSTNVDVAQRFYSQLFGWSAEPMPIPGGTYVVFKQGGQSVAGLTQQPAALKGHPSFWASYFAVADADATVASATRLGARVLLPLTDLPGVGRFGWLQDSQGAIFAVIKNAR
jgi:predicted enzyme related to lactoylglutathione lyase